MKCASTKRECVASEPSKRGSASALVASASGGQSGASVVTSNLQEAAPTSASPASKSATPLPHSCGWSFENFSAPPFYTRGRSAVLQLAAGDVHVVLSATGETPERIAIPGEVVRFLETGEVP